MLRKKRINPGWDAPECSALHRLFENNPERRTRGCNPQRRKSGLSTITLERQPLAADQQFCITSGFAPCPNR